MTKAEAAVVAAYTGYLIGEFHEMHKYAEKVMKSPIFTHQLGNKEFAEALRKASKPDFVRLKAE